MQRTLTSVIPFGIGLAHADFICIRLSLYMHAREFGMQKCCNAGESDDVTTETTQDVGNVL